MLAPNSWKPIHSGARLTIKVPMPCHPFSKGNINTWHRLLQKARLNPSVGDSLGSRILTATKIYETPDPTFDP